MAETDNCLNYLLPAKRDSEIISRHQTAKEYPCYVPNQLSLINLSFHTHCQTINDCLDVTAHSFCRTLVSIQLLNCHINKPVDYWLINW